MQEVFQEMNIKLICGTNPTPLLAKIYRLSHDSTGDSSSETFGPKDIKLLRDTRSWGHTSPLEFIDLIWYIEDMSRACLQQLVRHRMASYCVQSTRFTLNKAMQSNDLSKLLKLTGNKYIDETNETALTKLVQLYVDDPSMANDMAKYMLPEAFLTKLYCKFNIKSFRNFLTLRADKHAHPEIRELAFMMIKRLRGTSYEILIEDIIKRVEDQGFGKEIGSGAASPRAEQET